VSVLRFNYATRQDVLPGMWQVARTCLRFNATQKVITGTLFAWAWWLPSGGPGQAGRKTTQGKCEQYRLPLS